jgi:hypothetical protein
VTIRTHVFTGDYGSQFLVSIFDDGHMTLALRDAVWGSWGPPIEEDIRYRGEERRDVDDVEPEGML